MLAPGQSVLDELDITGCDVAEVECIIGSRVGAWGGDPNDSRALLFPCDQEKYALKLIYDRKHHLRDALAGPGLDEDTLAAVKLQIKSDLLNSGNRKVGNWVLFSPVPVTGAFRYQQDFQILPVPKNAPRPTFFATDHPFLLQFRYSGCANLLVDASRAMRRGREIELILSGFVSPHIHRKPDSHEWLLPPRTDTVMHGAPIELSSIFCQASYFHPDMKGVLDEFTAIDRYEAFVFIAGVDYRGRFGRRIGQVLDLPSDFERAISVYDSLAPEQKLRLNNSCYWFQQSSRFFRNSKSASYIALVLAIEALMPPPEAGPECKYCHRRAGKGPTHQAQDLYKTRSKLAHGEGLLISDQRDLLAPALGSFDDWQSHDRLSEIVRTAIVNWVLAEAGDVHAGSMEPPRF